MRQAVAGRLATLTPRERQVMELIVAGQANKNVASALGVSQRTVEVHRARVHRDLGALNELASVLCYQSDYEAAEIPVSEALALARDLSEDNKQTLLTGSFEQLLGKASDKVRQDAFHRLREHFERCGKPREIARFQAMLEALPRQ